MAVQPPKIDKRTEEEIVNQTVALAQYYTSWVEPTPEALRDRILASELVLDDGTTYAVGTQVTPEKAVKISEKYHKQIQVKGWNSLGQTPQSDAGLALIKIFGRMASQISDRLNQSLNKNFLAFLNQIGTKVQPPRSARVPLTFYLATGSTSALVPAGTQVAAPPQAGEEDEVIFETEKDLTMTSVQLQAVFVSEPDLDQYSDRTLQATGKEDEAFFAFAGHRSVEHSFYLAQDDLFTLAAPKKATLTINSKNGTGLGDLPITWSYWDGTVWQPLLGIVEGLTVVVDAGQDRVRVLPGKAVDSQRQQIDLTQERSIDLQGQRDKTVTIVISRDGSSARVQAVSATSDTHPADTYIRLAYLKINNEGEISKSLPAETGSASTWQVLLGNLPVPTKININGTNAAWLKAQIQQTALPPNAALPEVSRIQVRVECDRSNITPDLCFYNTTALDLSKDFYPFGERPSFNDTFYLASEDVFSKAGMTVTVNLTLSEGLPINKDGDAQVLWEAWDGTTWQEVKQNTAGVSAANFTGKGEMTLTLPDKMAPHAVNGETNYWVRARLVRGNYGTDNSSWEPPSVQSLKLAYTYNSGDRPLDACLTYNNFTYIDRTTAASSSTDEAFPLFTSTTETRPALYLGFDWPFANQLTTLYLRVAPPLPGEVAQRETVTAPAKVVWEYASPDGWQLLEADDETETFSDRGLIEFIGPTDFSSRSEFGQQLYWLRGTLGKRSVPD